jgi:hypothetical protein
MARLSVKTSRLRAATLKSVWVTPRAGIAAKATSTTPSEAPRVFMP